MKPFYQYIFCSLKLYLDKEFIDMLNLVQHFKIAFQMCGVSVKNVGFPV